MKKRRNLENKIESTKTLRFRPVRDELGEYIPYCNFAYHRGIAISYDICLERKCKYYKKLYLGDAK